MINVKFQTLSPDYPRVKCNELEMWANIGDTVSLQCSIFANPRAEIKMTFGVNGTEKNLTELQNAEFREEVTLFHDRSRGRSADADEMCITY